jgi:hypothetical protein
MNEAAIFAIALTLFLTLSFILGFYYGYCVSKYNKEE